MCKTGHEHAANKETNKPRVRTKHDKHESLNKTNAEQDKTRERKMKTMNVHGQRRAQPKRTRDHILPQQDQTWSASLRTPTRNQNRAWNKTRVPGSEHHTPTWNKARRRESTRKQDKKGVLGLCHKTMNKLDWKDRTLTLQPPPPPKKTRQEHDTRLAQTWEHKTEKGSTNRDKEGWEGGEPSQSQSQKISLGSV